MAERNHDKRVPNESADYRKARNELRTLEQELIDKTKAVAAARRKLPQGGRLMSCTSLMDGFDRAWYAVAQDAAFVAISKAPPEKIDAWVKPRGWTQIPIVSGYTSSFQRDYGCQQADNDDMQWPVMLVFRKMDEGIFHFWSTEDELEPRRHGVAVLESDGLHAGGKAGAGHAAADVRERVSGEALPVNGG